MLGYLAGCFTWGLVKAASVGAPRTHDLGASFIGAPLVEELQFRLGLERLALGRVLSPERARIAGAIFFGAMHPGLEVDAALGGYVYSKAYESHGLKGAVFAHMAHNLGCWVGGI